MAKSLRAKNKQRNKSLKRLGHFGDIHQQRLERLSEKLKAGAIRQIAEAKEKEDDQMIDKTEEDVVVVQSEKPKLTKVSTSGWKNKKKHGNKRSKSRR